MAQGGRSLENMTGGNLERLVDIYQFVFSTHVNVCLYGRDCLCL